MLDLEQIRKANQAALLGTAADATSKKKAYTKEDVATNQDVVWDIISLCVRKETVEKTNKRTGATYPAQGKNLAFPELTETVTVGKRKTGKNAEKDIVVRTNIETMREMYETRNSMIRHYQDDIDEKYLNHFASIVEVLDSYALSVVTEMIAADEEFLARVNKARGC